MSPNVNLQANSCTIRPIIGKLVLTCSTAQKRLQQSQAKLKYAATQRKTFLGGCYLGFLLPYVRATFRENGERGEGHFSRMSKLFYPLLEFRSITQSEFFL